MREFIDRLLGRLLIVVAALAAASLVAQYGFFLHQRYSGLVVALDRGIISFFIAESLIRLLINREKLSYLRAHWIDFAFIGLLAVEIVSLRFYAESELVSGFLAKLDITSVTKAYIIAVQVYIAAVLFIKTIEANRLIAKLNLTAPQLVLLSFGTMIGIGTLLLLVPRATTTGHSMHFVDALFTATSATCVTGLIVVDTGSYFSSLGQGIILALIQIGGLGIMSLTAFAAVAIGKGMGIRESALMKDVLSSDFIGEVTKLVRNIVIITVLFEVVGVLALSRIWASDFTTPLTTFYYALFHSVSAFCNAGFSLFDTSLEEFAGRPDIVLTFAVLIIVGGLGFMVISNVASWCASRVRRETIGVRLSLHSRTVLIASALLVVLGAVVFYLLEAGTMSAKPQDERVLSALFSSVTARTAGFNTVSMAAIATPTALVIMLLMFVGASPGGTGGGIKTTTLAVLLATLRSILRGRPNAEFLRRGLPQPVVNRAICVVILSIGLVFMSAVCISIVEHQPLTEVLFETVSAFGTVGLSRGLTRDLTTSSKIVIIITMFFGRIGPLTLGLAIGQRAREPAYTYPVEGVMIG